MQKKFAVFIVLFAALAAGLIVFAGSKQEVKSRAYTGHENDRDVKNFVHQYPKTAGTRLDDCQTCHRSGVAGTDTEREYSPCGYCHILKYGNTRYKTGVPKTYQDTLNAYGLAYKQKGRTPEALAAIAEIDTDGDSFPNSIEIADLRYPGESASRPGQPMAPIVTLKWDALRKLPHKTQFMLMNTHSEQFDDYAGYTGVRVHDILNAAKVDLSGATGITVFAPDGYSTDYSIDDIKASFPKPYFYSAPKNIMDKEKQLVRYPALLPSGVVDGKEVPMIPYLLLAFERDGKLLDVAQYEKETGRLTGEGPYRLVKPQRDVLGDPVRPGRPDRSVKSKKFGDEWDYVDALDHNAGSCVRGATAIRINPIPAGYEEYDWKNGWPLISKRSIVIFGKGVKGSR
jgi:hypothetical protein